MDDTIIVLHLRRDHLPHGTRLAPVTMQSKVITYYMHFKYSKIDWVQNGNCRSWKPEHGFGGSIAKDSKTR